MTKKRHSPIIEIEAKAVKKIGAQRNSFAGKYPWVFALAGAFGIVSIFYGFEKIIDRIDLFTENPWILLATGIAILAITGSFYNKLR